MDEKLKEWSRNVKIRDGWVCDCGELDRELLDSHHIEPKYLRPDLIYEVDNGRILCLWCHAKAHWSYEAVRNKILARLAIILYGRLYGKSRTDFGKRRATEDVSDKRFQDRREQASSTGPGKARTAGELETAHKADKKGS